MSAAKTEIAGWNIDDLAPGWTVEESGWDPKRQGVRETQFTLGNGFLCCRGILEEVPYDSSPGTYLNGVFDSTGAQITELVNFPNPIHFRMDVYGEKLDPVAMDVIQHSRKLDLLRGTLLRRTLYRTTHSKKLEYRSRRFVSMHDKNLIVMEVALTPLDAAMTVNAQTMIDAGVSNRGALTEGRKRHYQPVDIGLKGEVITLGVETFEHRVRVVYASALEVCQGGCCKMASDRAVRLRVRKGETVLFRKYISIQASREAGMASLKRSAIATLAAARRRGSARLFADNERAWARRWSTADVEIAGDNHAAMALRFNLYHLIVAASDSDPNSSIGARTLSGEGYRGHIFWDAEIFAFPFFLFTDAKVARNMLMYRYERLDAARNNASAKGYRGALFPWESADSGNECTPSWAKNFDGRIIKIVTMDEEHHIVSDVAWAFAQYCAVTGDEAFRWGPALEVMAETARFWSSRVVRNEAKGRYEIHHAMGPDEFHENVNNSAYTNIMAAWNLETAAEWCLEAGRECPARFGRLTRRMKLEKGEIAHWRRIAREIHVPRSRRLRMLEPFDGYLRLKDCRITKLDEHLMPVLPGGATWERIGRTQLIKQADVVMLLCLFPEMFSFDEKKRTYRFYERRTLHKSSLSPAIHAIVGLETGDEDRALQYFSHALLTDLANIHGNTAEGFHAASAGATWQAAVMGFAGMRFCRGRLEFNPHLPAHWRAMRFRISFRGSRIRVCITRQCTEVCLEERPIAGPIVVEVGGEAKELKRGEFVRFDARRPGKVPVRKPCKRRKP